MRQDESFITLPLCRIPRRWHPGRFVAWNDLDGRDDCRIQVGQYAGMVASQNRYSPFSKPVRSARAPSGRAWGCPKLTALTAARARELLIYDPETGALTWKVGRPGVRVGALVGTRTSEGYTQIEIDSRCIVGRNWSVESRACWSQSMATTPTASGARQRRKSCVSSSHQV